MYYSEVSDAFAGYFVECEDIDIKDMNDKEDEINIDDDNIKAGIVHGECSNKD